MVLIGVICVQLWMKSGAWFTMMPPKVTISDDELKKLKEQVREEGHCFIQCYGQGTERSVISVVIA